MKEKENGQIPGTEENFKKFKKMKQNLLRGEKKGKNRLPVNHWSWTFIIPDIDQPQLNGRSATVSTCLL